MLRISRKNLIPDQLFIETSNICNADCIFCTYRYDKRTKKIMGFDDYASIVEQYWNIGGRIINFTPYAGEVFTDLKFMDKVRYANKFDFLELNTYTNATLLDKFGSDNILKSGLTSIAVSTAPPDKETYELIFKRRLYVRMMNNLVALIERFHELDDKTVREIRVEFRSDRPMAEIEKMPDYQKIAPYIHGGVKATAMTDFDSWMGMIKPDDLLPGMQLISPDFAKTKPCDRLYMIKVTSNGKIRACGCRYDYSKDVDDFYLGHTKEMSLLDAYNGQKLKDLKNSFYENKLPEECVNCSWYETHRYGGK